MTRRNLQEAAWVFFLKEIVHDGLNTRETVSTFVTKTQKTQKTQADTSNNVAQRQYSIKMARDMDFLLQSPEKAAQTLLEKPQPEQMDFNVIDKDMAFLRNVDFNITAGTVTFHPDTFQVLVILNKKYHEHIWQFPKGRKDLDEDLRAAAIRETHEETGYRVKLVSARMETRATRPRVVVTNAAGIAALSTNHSRAPPPEKPSSGTVDDPNTEPLGMVVCSDPQANSETAVTKLCFFYLATLADPKAGPDRNTQDAGEKLEARWMSVADARQALRFQADQEALLCANKLWTSSSREVTEEIHVHRSEQDSQDETSLMCKFGQTK